MPATPSSTPRRAALYARFSSEMQNETSCEDQLFLCRALAARDDMIIVTEYEDRAISGASTINRMGLGRLMRDARERRFDLVVCESLDRLSRDQADLAKLRKDLAFLDIGIVTLQDGAVGAIHIGLKGLMSELFLADLAQRTRRGQAGRIRAGASGGGKSYGYTVDAAARGELLIDEREAETVRRIFAAFVAGDNARTIAGSLNRDDVASPRGGKWNASTITGSRVRQNGILQNSLYIGERVWNRQRFIKDPATGRRVSRRNPESEWQRAEVPALAILDRPLWDTAQARLRAIGKIKPAHQRRPRHLLSGLLFCGECGASYTVVGNGRCGCAGFRERGDCANNRTVTVAHIEQRVLAALEGQLAAPDLVAEYVRTYHEEARKAAAASRGSRTTREARLTELAAAIERAVDLLVTGKAPAALLQRLRDMEEEKASLAAEASAARAEGEVLLLHPNAADQYRKIVAELQQHLTGLKTGEPADRLVEKTRALIDRVIVHPQGSKKPVELEVHGLIAQLLMASTGSSSPFMGKLVAGARLTREYTATSQLVPENEKALVSEGSHSRLALVAGTRHSRQLHIARDIGKPRLDP